MGLILGTNRERRAFLLARLKRCGLDGVGFAKQVCPSTASTARDRA